MGFEDLEKRLKTFFKTAKTKAPSELKQSLRFVVLEKFEAQQQRQKLPWWKGFYAKFGSLATGALAIALLANVFSLQKENIFAGQILPKNGVIEIIRNGEVILVKSPTELQIGDVIKVGNNSEAELMFEDHFSSIAKTRTKFQIIDKNTVFLQEGLLLNQSLGEEGEISTDRGFVRSTPGASFHVEVSESGETRVVSAKNQITVFDWKDGQAVLNAGEEVKLRTDTSLANTPMPEDLKLSLAQIMAIRSKLVITRTKILNGLESYIAGNNKEGNEDIESAERTYLSIVQVMASTRDLEITKRKSIDLVDLDEVHPILARKLEDESILTEAKALESLFGILKNQKNNFGFVVPSTDLTSYDRFVILDRILQLGTTDQKKHCEVLKEKYVTVFLRNIQDTPLKIDQITYLNREIERLPKNELTKEFLTRLSKMLPPDLKNILEEKIESLFE